MPGDELKWVRRCTDEDIIAIVSQSGMLLLSSCGMVRNLICCFQSDNGFMSLDG